MSNNCPWCGKEIDPSDIMGEMDWDDQEYTSFEDECPNCEKIVSIKQDNIIVIRNILVEKVERLLCAKCNGTGRYLPHLSNGGPGINCDYTKKCPKCEGTGYFEDLVKEIEKGHCEHCGLEFPQDQLSREGAHIVCNGCKEESKEEAE